MLTQADAERKIPVSSCQQFRRFKMKVFARSEWASGRRGFKSCAVGYWKGIPGSWKAWVNRGEEKKKPGPAGEGLRSCR